MNQWEKSRQRSGWRHTGLVEWTEDNTAFLSVVFSWNLANAFQRAVWYRTQGYAVRVGGPAALMNPTFFVDVADSVNDDYPDAIAQHNPNATFTSRGCVRRCEFCLVPKIEGRLVELDDWSVRPVICDNNLLACSQHHFDSVVDKLKSLTGVDFNQGLDARLLTPYHAERLAELDLRCVRLAWDHTRLERQFMAAFETLTSAGIPASKIRVYVLIGYNDTPDDALYRLETVRGLGAWPNPSRYQPLDAPRRNGYIGVNWTDAELKRYMRYWYNLRFTGSIPFSEFAQRGYEPRNAPDSRQIALPIGADVY